MIRRQWLRRLPIPLHSPTHCIDQRCRSRSVKTRFCGLQERERNLITFGPWSPRVGVVRWQRLFTQHPHYTHHPCHHGVHACIVFDACYSLNCLCTRAGLRTRADIFLGMHVAIQMCTLCCHYTSRDGGRLESPPQGSS